ncbi:HD domain-containing protein [Bacillus sp. PS06]|uniref:HD domain-containing protein n=1 Tax=Bacillus sp. PS06 TaxID=2764176 RepID=UPI0017868208|nr:HD domain-containing protein [Bacillus sp. PS06]MBD8067696.1 HD domain-containing protein [Bacillus sp. PS06]
MGIHIYFKSLSNLEGIIRCPGKFKYQEHSVASHSFKVTKIAQFLATVEEMHGTPINWKLVYEKAINHDYSELFTGDIMTPVKYALPKLKELFTQVEESMIRDFIGREFPEEFQKIYEERFCEGKDDSIEGRILAIADKIDLLYESFGEIIKGNPEPLFIQIYQEALETILQYKDMSCVQYFIDNILQEIIDEETALCSTVQKVTKETLQNAT